MLFNKIIYEESNGAGVTSDDMLRMQHGNKSNFVYIFDNCHSGSATDDALSKAVNTKAILSAAATNELAYQGDNGKGAFMEKVFSYMLLGCSLGEAYVRSDIDLSSKKDEHQNPKAVLRTEFGVIQVASKDANRPAET